ncbi:MAG: NTPase [Actinomycetota bacterium]
MNILITGSPGVGKTTLIKRVLEELRCDAGGFYTEEIREGGIRKGFKIITLDGEEGILAHVGIKSPFRVSKYGVDVNEFERVGVLALEDAIRGGKVIVIDEIGKMELFSQRFKEAVKAALGAPSLVLATMGKISSTLVREIKEREDVRLLEVTFKNRASMVAEIVGLIRAGGKSDV